MTASMSFSGTSSALPTVLSSALTISASLRVACVPQQKPAASSFTSAFRLGITRITRTPDGSAASMAPIVIPAAIDTTRVPRLLRAGPHSASTVGMMSGFVASHTTSLRSTTLMLFSVAKWPDFACFSRRGAKGSATDKAAGDATAPDFRKPPMRAEAIIPPPTKPTFGVGSMVSIMSTSRGFCVGRDNSTQNCLYQRPPRIVGR